MSTLGNATETIKKPIGWMKSNPWSFAILALVLGVVFLRYSDTVKTKVVAGANAGSSFYKFLASVLGYSLAGVIGLFFLLSSGSAVAAVANHAPMVSVADGSTLSHILAVLGGIAGLGVMGYVAELPTKGIVFNDSRNGDQIRTMTAGQQIYWDLKYPTHRRGRRILVATEIQIKVRATFTMGASSTAPLISQYGDWIKNINLELKHGIGVTHPDTLCTGRYLRHVLSPMLRKGLMGSPYEVQTADTGALETPTRTVEFICRIPFTNESADRPLDTAIPLALLDDAILTITSEVTSGGEDWGTGAVTCSVSTVVAEKRRGGNEIPSFLVPCRYTVPASGGQTNLRFQGVGKIAGPSGMNTENGSRLVFAALPGAYEGGPDMFDDLTRFGCAQLGLKETTYVEDHYLSIVGAIDKSRAARGTAHLNTYQEWPQDQGAASLVDYKSICLFFPLMVCPERVKTTQLPIVNGTIDLDWVKSTPTATGEWVLHTIEIRDSGAAVQAAATVQLQGRNGTQTKKSADGKSVIGQVANGDMHVLDTKGLPIGLEDQPQAGAAV